MNSNGQSMEDPVGHMFRGVVKDILFNAKNEITFVIQDDGEEKPEFVSAPLLKPEGIDEIFGSVSKALGKRVVYYVDDKNKMISIQIEQ
jgi:hypothetical protein